eukprot:1156239-Pelagomonas_calceolata.AAC.6
MAQTLLPDQMMEDLILCLAHAAAGEKTCSNGCCFKYNPREQLCSTPMTANQGHPFLPGNTFLH